MRIQNPIKLLRYEHFTKIGDDWKKKPYLIHAATDHMVKQSFKKCICA